MNRRYGYPPAGIREEFRPKPQHVFIPSLGPLRRYERADGFGTDCGAGAGGKSQSARPEICRKRWFWPKTWSIKALLLNIAGRLPALLASANALAFARPEQGVSEGQFMPGLDIGPGQPMMMREHPIHGKPDGRAIRDTGPPDAGAANCGRVHFRVHKRGIGSVPCGPDPFPLG